LFCDTSCLAFSWTAFTAFLDESKKPLVKVSKALPSWTTAFDEVLSSGASTNGILVGVLFPNPLATKLNGDVLVVSAPEEDSCDEDSGTRNPLAHCERLDIGFDLAGPSLPSPREDEDLNNEDRDVTRVDCWSLVNTSEEDRARRGPVVDVGRISDKPSASVAVGPAMVSHTLLKCS
jgi:hypothetical protein